jgi:hypothetical protein
MMPEEHWHLRKEIPVALIFTILLQTGGALWWAASINQRVAQIEQRLDSAAIRAQNIDNVVANQATQIAVLVSRMDEQTRRIEETNDLLREYLRRTGNGTP